MRFREKELVEIYPQIKRDDFIIWFDLNVLYPFSFTKGEARITICKYNELGEQVGEALVIPAIPRMTENISWYRIECKHGTKGIPVIFSKEDAGLYIQVSTTVVFYYQDKDNQTASAAICDRFCLQIILPESRCAGDYLIERQTTMIPEILEDNEIQKRREIVGSHEEVIQATAILKGKNIYNMPIMANQIKSEYGLEEQELIGAAKKTALFIIKSRMALKSEKLLINIFMDRDIYSLTPISMPKRKRKKPERSINLGFFFD